MTSLTERIEAAPEVDADLFREAATAVFGEVPDQMNRFLAAGAYLNAAMLLTDSDDALFSAIADGAAATDKSGVPRSEWESHLPRYIAAAALRARGVE